MYAKELNLIKKRTIDLIGQEDWQSEFSEFWSNLPLHTACIELRLLSAKYIRLAKAIKQHVHTKYLSNPLPLMVPSDEIGTIYVYPNLLIQYDALIDPAHLARTTFVTHIDVIRPTLEAIESISKDNNKKKQFETWSRTRKYFRKKETTTLARALTRYTTLKSDYSDADIRDVAEKINDELRPLEITFCKTPEDYATMYATGPQSCMSYKDGRDWHSMLKETGLHPASFYHYVPGAQGVYVAKGNKVLARCLTYTISGKPGKTIDKKYYSRIYAANDAVKAKLINELKLQGYTPVPRVEFKEEFRVPGAFVKDYADYVCPLPFVDGIATVMYVNFDIPKKEFVFHTKPDANTTSINFGGTRGILHAKEIISGLKCHLCSRKIAVGKAISPVDGKHTFCSGGCAHEYGYVYARRNDGSQVWVNRAEAIQIFGNSNYNTYFTNMHSAKKNGYWPVMRHIGVIDFDAVWNGGYYLLYHNEMCMVIPSLMERLQAGVVSGFRLNGRKRIKNEYLNSYDVDILEDIPIETQENAAIDW